MVGERSISRRKFIGSIVSAGVLGAIAGSLGGYFMAPREISMAPVTETVTITKTIAQPTTQTITQPVKRLETIKIGSAHPLTGWDAPSGREMHRGSEMAVEEINKQGGVLDATIEWVELDSEDMTAEKMTSVMTILATKEKVNWVIYGYTAAYTPTYTTLAQYNIPFMHVDTAYEFIEWIKGNPDKAYLGWMPDPPEVIYGAGFAKFIEYTIDREIWKPRNYKVAVIRGEDSYAQRIAQRFIDEMVKKGWKVVLDETVSFETVDFEPYLAKVRVEEPDVILNTDWAVTGFANFAKQFSEDPTPSWILGQWAPSVPEFKEMAGDAANGIVWSSVIGFLPPEKDPVAREWYEKYKRRYGEEPGLMAAVNYDMFWLWANAAQLAGSIDPKKMAPVLERLIYRGVCGVYNFNEYHYCISYPSETYDPSLGLPHLHYQIKKGRDVLVAPTPYSVEEPELPSWFH